MTRVTLMTNEARDENCRLLVFISQRAHPDKKLRETRRKIHCKTATAALPVPTRYCAYREGLK